MSRRATALLGGPRRAEFILVHFPEGRDGYVQIAQGKLQEHDELGRTGKDIVVSACVYLEVRDSLCVCTSRNGSSSGQHGGSRPAI